MDILSYKLGKGASGGGGGGLDWTTIGFTGTPQSLTTGYNRAKQIMNNWVPNSSMYRKYYQDYKLMFFPTVDTSTTTNFNSMFEMCFGLVEVAEIDTSNGEYMASMFASCRALKVAPQLDTSKCSNIGSMFNDCRSLEYVPVYDWSNVSTVSFIFTDCYSLSDESLNNIMASCITATKVSSTNKKLSKLGITSAQATRCQSLSNYNDFISAGWTTGY